MTAPIRDGADTEDFRTEAGPIASANDPFDKMMDVDHQDVLDHGYVKTVEVWGSDQRIVESARMSTSKGFKGWGGVLCVCVNRIALEADMTRAKDSDKQFVVVGGQPDCEQCKGTGHTVGDEKFLKFLWDHKHLSPFEQAGFTIEVQAPIFVFREWHRHRTQSYNEMSGRYAVLPDLTYVPSLERMMAARQSTVNKQGSGGVVTEPVARACILVMQDSHREARKVYEELLKFGVAREVARGVLSVSQYSRMRASANLRNWLAFLTLRMAPDAQWEIRQYANAVGKLVAAYFPRTWELFAAER